MQLSKILPTSVFLLLLAVGMIRGKCTKEELNTLLNCTTTYGQVVNKIFNQKGVCNKTAIDPEICSAYTKIIKCINTASVSATTCRPFAVEQVTTATGTPCSVYDFMLRCTTAPLINMGNDGASRMKSIHAVSVVTLCCVIAAFLRLKAFEEV